jgi:fumarate hydratase class I
MSSLSAPFTESQIRALKVGDPVEITGTLFTGRDAVHKYFAKGGSLPTDLDLQNSILYHCGPVVLKDNSGQYRVVAAGPTTSAREEPYQADLIARFQLRAVIGKGGMGERTLTACQQHGCVYLHAIGGAAQVLADRIQCVRSVHFLEEFGSPEAIWELQVDRFPAVVTMDAHGGSLHRDVLAASQARMLRLLSSP